VPDPRLTRLAEVLCRYSLEVGEGDTVLVTGPTVAQPLFVELVKTITSAGAHPMLRPHLERAEAAILREATEAQVAAVTRLEELEIEAPTRQITIWANENTRYMADVPASTQAARSAATRRLFERFLEREAADDVRWCGTAFPCHAAAQDAGMSLAAWEDFVFSAGHLDDADPIAFWRAQSDRQAQVIERLAGVREIRIVAEDTDLTIGVGGRVWANADGRKNFPDGEVYTSPVETATRGHIAFTFDATYLGNDVGGVRLRFEDGRVVAHEARKNADFLGEMLGMDAGARCLGEFAFGMNDEIQTATRDTLFDEKIGGTCHMALGMAFPECGGLNRSGLHWDLVCDLRSGGEVYADGDLVGRDGRFV
jgi:aminopeptidase